MSSAAAKMTFWRKRFHCSLGRCTYGWRRLQKGLLRESIACGKKRILRLMRDQELEVIQKRAFRPKTTQNRHDQPIAPNRLKALPEPPQKPNEVWCADITYIPSQQEGWLYLAGELDLCSRRLVGWKLDTSMAAPLVPAAFERAVKNWANLPVLHHSDRGVQYASSDFRQLLDSYPGCRRWPPALSLFTSIKQKPTGTGSHPWYKRYPNRSKRHFRARRVGPR